MRALLTSLTLALSLAAGGCSPPGPLDPAAPLQIDAEGGEALRLRNATGRPIYFLVMEREHQALVLWAPCDSPDQACPSLQARGEARIGYGDIGGYRPGAREAVVHWWHLVQADGGWKVDRIRSVVVRL